MAQDFPNRSDPWRYASNPEHHALNPTGRPPDGRGPFMTMPLQALCTEETGGEEEVAREGEEGGAREGGEGTRGNEEMLNENENENETSGNGMNGSGNGGRGTVLAKTSGRQLEAEAEADFMALSGGSNGEGEVEKGGIGDGCKQEEGPGEKEMGAAKAGGEEEEKKAVQVLEEEGGVKCVEKGGEGAAMARDEGAAGHEGGNDVRQQLIQMIGPSDYALLQQVLLQQSQTFREQVSALHALTQTHHELERSMAGGMPETGRAERPTPATQAVQQAMASPSPSSLPPSQALPPHMSHAGMDPMAGWYARHHAGGSGAASMVGQRPWWDDMMHAFGGPGLSMPNLAPPNFPYVSPLTPRSPSETEGGRIGSGEGNTTPGAAERAQKRGFHPVVAKTASFSNGGGDQRRVETSRPQAKTATRDGLTSLMEKLERK